MFKLFNLQALKSALYIGLFSALLTSCGGDKVDHANYIPANACVVMSVNTEAILGDAFFDLITNNAITTDFAAGPLSGLIQDPSSAGLKRLDQFHFFAVGQNFLDGKMGAVLPLDDSEKLAKYVETNFGAEVMEDNGFLVAEISTEHNLVWDKNTAIYYYGAFGGDLVKEAEALFKQTPEQSLAAADSTFAYALNSGAHISTWFNNDDFISFIDEGLSMAVNLKLFETLNVKKEDITGAKSVFLTNFNNGNITVDQRQYLNSKQIKAYSGFEKENNISSLIPIASNEDPLMMASVSLKSAGLVNLLKEYKIDKAWDEQMKNLPKQIKIDQLAQFFEGDVLILLNDIEKVTQTRQIPGIDDEGEDIMETKEITSDRPQFTVGMTLKNAAIFKMFFDGYTSFLPKVDGFSSFNNELFFAIEGKHFLLTTTQSGIKALKSMSGKLKPELNALASNHKTAFYLNTTELLNKGSKFLPVKVGAAKNLKNVIVSEKGIVVKGVIEGKTTISFYSEENGLISTIKLFSGLGEVLGPQLGSIL